MSFDGDQIQNKMMTTPPAKKEFHFAANAEYFAEVVYADTIEEAEKIYHQVKRRLGTTPDVAPLVPDLPEQSTPAVDEENKQ